MLKVRALPPGLQEIAERELHEKPERLAADVEAIRTWLNKQSHLQNINPPDQTIVSFLRGNKFSLERTKEKLDMSYTLRSLVPEIFQNRDPLKPQISDLLKRGFCLPLPITSKNGPRLMLVQYNFPNGHTYSLEYVIKLAFMVVEILIQEDDNFIVVGEDSIVDLKDLGIANALSQWTPAFAKKVVMSFEKALPVRVKNMHILNPPATFETLFSVVKIFMSEKLKKRIQLHYPPFDSLHKLVPRESLPVEYGGSNGNIQDLTDYWKSKVESYRDWFLSEEKLRSDESKRSQPQTASSLFGVEGSFRKLDVD